MMDFQTRVEQGQVVIQTEQNQLLLTSIENINDNRLVTVPFESIKTFVLAAPKSDLLAIQGDRQWQFFRFSSGLNIEAKIEAKSSFQLAFLHLDALWLGTLQSSKAELTEPKVATLSLEVHQLSSGQQSRVTVPFECSIGHFQLVEYTFWQDRLACALVNEEESSLIVQFRLADKAEVDLLSTHKVSKRVSKLEGNPENGLLVVVTEDRTVHLLENNALSQWTYKTQLDIQTICFDVHLPQSFWVTTENDLFLLYYINQEHPIVLLESLIVKDHSPVVASNVPCLFYLLGNSVKMEQHPELVSLASHQKLIESIFSLDTSQFVKSLRNSQSWSGGDSAKSAVWLIMAKRCLAQRDIDSAIYCAAKIGEARLVRSLKHEMATRGQLAACALLALNLGFPEEAEKILEADTNGQSQICQLQNKWNKAFLSADKMQIKSAYYNYARFLEEESKVTDAIKFYEMSGNALEVPRMLFETGNVSQLEEYCLREHQNEKVGSSLVTWWGQYCESQGDHTAALEMYESVPDYYNLVRLLCHVGDVARAEQLVNEQAEKVSGEKATQADIIAAMLYLGKHLESIHSTESIRYYLLCGAKRHAIRVCIENQLFDELVDVAVGYCAEKEAKHILNTYGVPNQALVREDNLIKLYYKCGYVKDAIHLAIQSQLWTQLREICHSELLHETPKFVEVEGNEILDMALVMMKMVKNDTSLVDIFVDLIIMSGDSNFSLITQTIQDYGINVDDQLMDKLEKYTETLKNPALVGTFAELCLEKGNYQLAAKLFNKIGKRVDSLKALIRLGNESLVIKFANFARDKTVFKLAANFLAVVNYADTSLITKFYTRAEAYEELDRFKRELESR